MDEPTTRTVSGGRCFVYLLPCREEDTLKIGFARDPWARLQAFHRRFDRFFDLGRGALIETDRVREARAIETGLKTTFADAATPAPLEVRSRAGGRFEWYRGVHEAMLAHMRGTSLELGFALHEPLDAWLREQWSGRSEHIADWSRHEFALVEMLHFNAPAEIAAPRARALRERLEIWAGIGLDIETLLAEPARYWYQYGFDDDAEPRGEA